MARAAFLRTASWAAPACARPRFHPPAVVLRLRHSLHHVDARDRRSARPADHLLVAPLMTCSARIPVYTDHRRLHSRPRGLGLRRPAGAGDVRLYTTGIVGALAVSFVLKRLIWRERRASRSARTARLQDAAAQSLAIGLWTRAVIFLKRAGTIILAMMILIWVLATFPQPRRAPPSPPSTTASRHDRHGDPALTAPLGFNWPINVALIPGRAAREVASLARTIYFHRRRRGRSRQDRPALLSHWSLGTALALLAGTSSPRSRFHARRHPSRDRRWKWMWITFAYMLVLAYVAALATYQIARALVLADENLNRATAAALFVRPTARASMSSSGERFATGSNAPSLDRPDPAPAVGDDGSDRAVLVYGHDIGTCWARANRRPRLSANGDRRAS